MHSACGKKLRFRPTLMTIVRNHAPSILTWRWSKCHNALPRRTNGLAIQKRLARQQLAIQNAGIGSQFDGSQLQAGTGTPTTGNPISGNLAASYMAASSRKELARQQLAIHGNLSASLKQPAPRRNWHANNWQPNMPELAASYMAASATKELE